MKIESNYHQNILLVIFTMSYTSIFECPECSLTFTNKRNWDNHISNNICGKEELKINNNTCAYCKYPFATKQSLEIHLKKAKCKHMPINLPAGKFIIKPKKQISLINDIIGNDNKITININIDKKDTKNTIGKDNKSLVKSLNNLKNKKVKIPKVIKELVWKTYIGDKMVCKCLICNDKEITAFAFECAHVEAEIKGGQPIVKNLRPICKSCNSSMYITNMQDFCMIYFPHAPVLHTF